MLLNIIKKLFKKNSSRQAIQNCGKNKYIISQPDKNKAGALNINNAKAINLIGIYNIEEQLKPSSLAT